MNLGNTRRFLNPLLQRVFSALLRGRVRLVNDAGERQMLQITLRGVRETRSEIERFQQYGLTSVPRDDAELVAARIAGAADHVVVIAVDDRRYRLRGLEKGEVALYDDLGSKIHLKRGGVIEIVANGGVKVVGNLDVDGAIKATGEVEDLKGTLDVLRQAFNQHTQVVTSGSTPIGTAQPPLPPV